MSVNVSGRVLYYVSNEGRCALCVVMWGVLFYSKRVGEWEYTNIMGGTESVFI